MVEKCPRMLPLLTGRGTTPRLSYAERPRYRSCPSSLRLRQTSLLETSFVSQNRPFRKDSRLLQALGRVPAVVKPRAFLLPSEAKNTLSSDREDIFLPFIDKNLLPSKPETITKSHLIPKLLAKFHISRCFTAALYTPQNRYGLPCHELPSQRTAIESHDDFDSVADICWHTHG